MSGSDFFRKQRVLVTGGTGFVGSHLVERLISMGATVIVPFRSIDPYGYFSSKQLQNNTTLVHCDLKDRQRVFDVMSRYEITFIFHLGAQAVVPIAYHNPYETLETNIMGTVNVLEGARLLPHIHGVIVASSDKAYGKSDRKYSESDALCGDHPYDVSKSAADLICQMYAKTYNVPVSVTRFGNIYGEGDTHPSRVIPGILLSIVRQESFVIRSNGLYKRAYLSVRDVVDGYLRLALLVQNVRGEAFNFGSPAVYSVLDLIAIIESTLGVSVPYTITNTAVNEIQSQELAFEKAITQLGWHPNTSFKGSIQPMLSWYTRYVQQKEGANRSGKTQTQTIFSL